MSNIKISVFGPAIRTNRWLSLYENIHNNNKVELEIVFCGNVKPDFSLPKNFNYIYSEVKPAQCAQIALNNTKSNLLTLVGDDCVYSKNFFDNLYEAHLKDSDNIYGGAFMRNNKVYSKENYMLLSDISESPFFPFSPLLNKDEVMSLGGIDKNFIAVMWHEDLLMRLITKYNKKCKILENSICYEETISSLSFFKRVYNKYFDKMISKKFLNPGPNLFSRYGREHDLPYLKSCWIGDIDYINEIEILCRNNKYFISKNRLKKFESFTDYNLNLKTQGMKGHWV